MPPRTAPRPSISGVATPEPREASTSDRLTRANRLTRRLHARYFSIGASRWAPLLNEEHQAAAFAWFDLEIDNLRAAAEWAVRFYERHGFAPVGPERTAELLRSYWTIPERQIETSVVLARPAP